MNMNGENNEIIFIRAWHNTYPDNIIPPLGIGSIISYVKERMAGLGFKVFDQAIDKDVYGNVVRYLGDRRPLLFGISAMVCHYKEAIELSKFLKLRYPEVPVAIGGPLVRFINYADVMMKGDIDFAIIGEGEKPILSLINYLLYGGCISDIKGIVYREGDEIHLNQLEEPLKPDEIPFPDYEDINLKEYFNFQGFQWLGERPYLPLFTSRGCPYRCAYCHNQFGRKVRYMELDKLVKSAGILIKKYGIDEVEIIDDIFNINEDRAMNIIRTLKGYNNKLRFSFPNGLRSDIMSEKFIDFLGNENAIFISIAIESASERIQKLINKNLNLQKAKYNTNLLARYGIILNGYFMIGFPTETFDEMIATVNFARQLPLHMASFFKVTIYQGTDLYNMLDKEQQELINRTEPTDLRYYGKHLNFSNVSDTMLDFIQKYALICFYFRPWQVYKFIREHPKPYLIFKGSKHLIKLFNSKFRL